MILSGFNVVVFFCLCQQSCQSKCIHFNNVVLFCLCLLFVTSIKPFQQGWCLLNFRTFRGREYSRGTVIDCLIYFFSFWNIYKIQIHFKSCNLNFCTMQCVNLQFASALSDKYIICRTKISSLTNILCVIYVGRKDLSDFDQILDLENDVNTKLNRICSLHFVLVKTRYNAKFDVYWSIFIDQVFF